MYMDEHLVDDHHHYIINEQNHKFTKEFKKIDKDITKLTSNKASIGIETESLERPLIEE